MGSHTTLLGRSPYLNLMFSALKKLQAILQSAAVIKISEIPNCEDRILMEVSRFTSIAFIIRSAESTLHLVNSDVDHYKKQCWNVYCGDLPFVYVKLSAI